IQRMPNLIPTFLSLYFLSDFLDSENLKGLLISYILFTFTFILAHYSIFFLPLFLLLPAFSALKRKMPFKLRLSFITISALFVLIVNSNNLIITNFYFILFLVLFIVAILIFFSYSDASNPTHNFGEDRIYFPHSIYVSIILGVILSGLISTKNICLKIILILFL